MIQKKLGTGWEPVPIEWYHEYQVGRGERGVEECAGMAFGLGIGAIAHVAAVLERRQREVRKP